MLAALKKWLEEQVGASSGKLTVPVMMLDDESDYASINVKEEDSPSAINEAIRDVLELFSRSSYTAFTATPFANIFIDHDIENDLFPRNYVYSLEAPTNSSAARRLSYCGGKPRGHRHCQLGDA